MSIDEERTELRERVYSRAGADDPRFERVDPVTGRTLLLTDSEWRLLELDRRAAASATPEASAAHRAAAPAGTRPPRPPSDTRRRRPLAARAATLVAVGLAAIVAGGAAGPGDPQPTAPAHGPAVTATVVPVAPPAAGAIAGPADLARRPGPMGAFLDPALRADPLPAWLELAFPGARAARVLGPDGPIDAVAVYAVATTGHSGCLVARIGARGMAVNCTGLWALAAEGLSLRTRIPAELATGHRGGDGILTVDSAVDVLAAEWQPDGTFRIARRPE
ncbi:hypothetical protein GCM10009819_25640 [Agromyces tropicus]|uniref:Uncharacterized protein n=1 Tax=Agromyces tropicus TaxID=555371 RepID=A0ABN2UMV6_9MICO